MLAGEYRREGAVYFPALGEPGGEVGTELVDGVRLLDLGQGYSKRAGRAGRWDRRDDRVRDVGPSW